MQSKVHTARAAAPVSLAGAAAPIAIPATSPKPSSLADSNDPELIALSAAAENALAAALKLLRDPSGTADDLQRAAGRVYRAATLMGRLCAARAEGGAA